MSRCKIETARWLGAHDARTLRNRVLRYYNAELAKAYEEAFVAALND